MITNKVASPQVPEFNAFYERVSSQMLPSDSIWFDVPQYLIELIYILIVNLPDKKLHVKDLHDHFIVKNLGTNSGKDPELLIESDHE